MAMDRRGFFSLAAAAVVAAMTPAFAFAKPLLPPGWMPLEKTPPGLRWYTVKNDRVVLSEDDGNTWADVSDPDGSYNLVVRSAIRAHKDLLRV